MEDISLFVARTAADGSQPASWDIVKLFGQASARQYFRAVSKADSSRTFVVMKLPQGFSSPAEEVTKIHPDAPRELPFLNMQRYLAGLNVNVPKVYGHDAVAGMILLEDLGDRSLESVLSVADDGIFLFYYKKVLDHLIDLQVRTFVHPPRDCVAYFRRFDGDLLNWEFDHFLEFGIEDLKQVKLDRVERAAFVEHTRAITGQIVAMPQGFTHRDFQSRNIMVHGYDFYVIDFQDALVGPVLYDLVALLRDSYILIDQEKLDTLLKYYHDHLPPSHPYAGRFADLRCDFFRITLQRKLKDFGRFQYISTVRHNPNFLTHMPLTLVYIRLAFMALPECAPLRQLIGRHIAELA